MMMICQGDVTNDDKLRHSTSEVYLTLLDTKVRELEASRPKQNDPRELVKKK